MTLKTLPSSIYLSSRTSCQNRDGRFCRKKGLKLYTLSLPMTLSAHIGTVSARRYHHSTQRQNSQSGSALGKPFISHRTIDTKTALHQRSYPVDAALLSADLLILSYRSRASVCIPAYVPAARKAISLPR